MPSGPNTTPIPELIATTLISRLEAIMVSNGYAFTVAGVDRVNRDATEWTPKNNTIVVLQDSEERVEELDCFGNPPAIAYQLTFAVKGFVRQSDRVTTADQARENEMAATIKKAIASSATWYHFGGSAINAQFGATERFEASDSHAGVVVFVDVFYRVSETDPYQVRA